MSPIAKPRLLITRFAVDALRLAKLLDEQGTFALAQPLLAVQKSAEFADAMHIFAKKYDYIIAVSRNAVDYADRALAGKSWPIAIYLAVGKRTAEKLCTVTEQKVIIPHGQFDSEGLLALPCLALPQGKRVLIVRGVGGRELLAERLTARGAIIEYYQPYQRVVINLSAKLVVEQWQQQRINGAIVGSLELLERLTELLPSEESLWLKKMTIYAPSKRITDHAIRLGWSNVEVLPGMSDKQIVDYFK
ncbi:uroporphyrinogen-III synthase [Psychromonas antarctica]|jgi:uroporphyrinogen-III synthase|uniref:uroporphyrinogen-III synthase n=1 Tax=Psychromonas antarctica TaxID=67573 RepID=UPI001EE9AD49|nr:uroporphyrinogen-III synthase [Psychromonas antarctica]MCG6200074.1 uroporphyrinogen-III synthase [Psychromonas antarctica]